MAKLGTQHLPIILAVVALAVAVSFGGYIIAGGNTAPGSGASGTVEVTGNGSVTTTPDTLTINIAVVTNAKSSATALNRNNIQTRQVEAIFIAAKVPRSQIATTGLSVSPTYNPNGAENGFSAEDDLTITMHQLSTAGATLDRVENAVGNDVQIQQVTYSLSSNATAMSQARVRAMQNAHRIASDLATGGGESLGSIQSIQQTSSSTPPPLPESFHAAATPAATPVPLRPGTQTVTVQVDVTYRLNH